MHSQRATSNIKLLPLISKQMKHKNIKVLCLVFGILLSGCAFTPSEQTSSVSSLSWSDPFDDPKITEQDLENNFCMVIENLRFLKGKEKNHAFAIRDGKIAEHRSYAKKKPIVSSFETTIGKPLFDVMEIIGIPSFRGRYDIDSNLPTFFRQTVMSTSLYR